MSPPGMVESERLDYALRRRIPALGSKTWNARLALEALAYASCQHMQGRKREEAQNSLTQEATSHLQALVWPGVELWQQHTAQIEVRRWLDDEALPLLNRRGGFAARGRRLAELVHARLVRAPDAAQLGDPALQPSLDEDARWGD